ncbi:MAG: hypothetical protein AAF713_16610 [Pseudomonadota bacterium]
MDGVSRMRVSVLGLGLNRWRARRNTKAVSFLGAALLAALSPGPTFAAETADCTLPPPPGALAGLGDGRQFEAEADAYFDLVNQFFQCQSQQENEIRAEYQARLAEEVARLREELGNELLDELTEMRAERRMVEEEAQTVIKLYEGRRQ